MRFVARWLRKSSLLGVGVALAIAWGHASAQAFPSRPVTIVCPFTVGTGVDIIARSLAQKFSERWAQPVVVENRVGAAGIVGSNFVARAAPDGHTLLVTSNAFLMTTLLTKSTPYDPLRDFEPVSYAGQAWMMAVAYPGAKIDTIPDLIRTAKAQPGKIAYASTGVGTPQHMAVELFKNLTGTDLLHVPYKGTGAAVTDIMSGQVQLMFLPVHSALPLVRSNKLKALAVVSPERHSTAPEVPTLKELGIAGAEVVVWYGLLATKGTPREVITKINADYRAVAALPDVRQSAASQGIELVATSPAEFTSFMTAELARWPKIIAEGNIKSE